MADRSGEPKPFGERIASIETDIKWVKWLAVGSFASSSIGTALKLGAPPAASVGAGLVAGFLGWVSR